MRWLAFVLASLCAAPAAAQDDGAREAEPVPDPPSVELRPVTVRFRTGDAGLRVHYMQDPVLDESGGRLVVRRGPPSRYSELCEAPCDVQLPQTHLGLAVSRGGHLHRFDAPLGVDGPTGVRLHWHDRSGLRVAGIIALILGGAAGVTTGALTLGLVDSRDEAAFAGGLVASTLLLGASVAVGLIFVLTEDAASFDVTPLPADAGALFSSDWQ